MKTIKAEALKAAQKFWREGEPFVAIKRDGHFGLLSYDKSVAVPQLGIPMQGHFVGLGTGDTLCVNMKTGALQGIVAEAEVEIADE